MVERVFQQPAIFDIAALRRYTRIRYESANGLRLYEASNEGGYLPLSFLLSTAFIRADKHPRETDEGVFIL